MAVIDAVIRTVTCGVCDKTITFNRAEEQKMFNENPWMLGLRVVQTADGRNFSYCSDLCEIKGTETGVHNVPQKKTVEIPNGPSTAAIQEAAKAAALAEAATKALKEGQQVTLHTA